MLVPPGLVLSEALLQPEPWHRVCVYVSVCVCVRMGICCLKQAHHCAIPAKERMACICPLAARD